MIKPALVALHVGARDVLRLGDALAGRPRGEVPQVERVNVHGVSGVVGQPRRLEVACDGIGPDARRLGCGRGGARVLDRLMTIGITSLATDSTLPAREK